MFTEEIKKSIQVSVLCWLATADESGIPNCSSKEVFTFYGESSLVIANIASPESVKNIRANANVCVSFIHVFKQKGFKLKGVAEYVTPESDKYPKLFELIQPMVGDVFLVQGIILVAAKSIRPIVAPAYYLVPGTTEVSQIKNAKQTYAVKQTL